MPKNQDGNGRSVTVRELNDKLNGIRWELRCYMALMALGVLMKFQIPNMAAAVFRYIF